MDTFNKAIALVGAVVSLIYGVTGTVEFFRNEVNKSSEQRDV